MNDEYLNWIKQIYEETEFTFFIESNATYWNLLQNNHNFFKTYDINDLKYNNLNILLDYHNKITKSYELNLLNHILERCFGYNAI